MTIVTLGIDLGKNLNSVVGLDASGQIVLRRRVRRSLDERIDALSIHALEQTLRLPVGPASA